MESLEVLGARQPLGRPGGDKKTMGGLDKQSHKGGGEVKSRSMTMEAAIHLTNRSLPLRRVVRGLDRSQTTTTAVVFAA